MNGPGSLAALLLAATAIPVHAQTAQSMVDAAAKERERRAHQPKGGAQSAPVFTNDDLAKGSGTPAAAASGAAAQGTAPGARRRVSDNPEVAAAEARAAEERPLGGDSEALREQEANWRSQATSARRTASEAEARLAKAEQEVLELAGRIRLSTDTHEILRLTEDKKKADTALSEARAALEGARAGLLAFEERARKAGVPPGWIR